MSSRYTNMHTNMHTLSRSPKMSFMKHWKAVGTFVSPKGMMHHSKKLDLSWDTPSCISAVWNSALPCLSSWNSALSHSQTPLCLKLELCTTLDSELVRGHSISHLHCLQLHSTFKPELHSTPLSFPNSALPSSQNFTPLSLPGLLQM